MVSSEPTVFFYINQKSTHSLTPQLRRQLPCLQHRIHNEANALVLCGSVRFDYQW